YEISTGRECRRVLFRSRILEVDLRALEQGIARANALRRTLTVLDAARVSDGPFYERRLRAALWSDATQWLGGIATPAPRDSSRQIGRAAGRGRRASAAA